MIDTLVRVRLTEDFIDEATTFPKGSEGITVTASDEVLGVEFDGSNEVFSVKASMLETVFKD